MATITEDYVSFETAKLLKDKGFDNISSIMYKENGEMCINPKSVVSWRLKYWYPCLTLQMAMKWLREVHNLFIQICIIPHTTITIEQKYYFFTIHKDRRTLAFRKDFPSEYYFTYEEACEAAIKYCLENLI